MKNLYVCLFAICTVFFILSCGGDKPTKNTETKVLSSVPKVVEGKKDEMKKVMSTDGGKTEMVQDTIKGASPEQLAKAKELISAVSDEQIEEINSETLFKIHCAICHGFKGNMMVNGAKDLTKSVINMEESVAQIYHGKGLMTPYKGILKDEEIVAVAKYTESLRN